MKIFIALLAILLCGAAQAQTFSGTTLQVIDPQLWNTFLQNGFSGLRNSPNVTVVPMVMNSNGEAVLTVDHTGYITVRGKPATNDQIVEALREFALKQTDNLR